MAIKTLFLEIFDLCSSIVKSFFNCRLSSVLLFLFVSMLFVSKTDHMVLLIFVFQVDKLAQLHNVHVRTGCFCNLGACQKFLNISDEELKNNFDVSSLIQLTSKIPTSIFQNIY